MATEVKLEAAADIMAAGMTPIGHTGIPSPNPDMQGKKSQTNSHSTPA